jgi:hypothetical protein
MEIAAVAGASSIVGAAIGAAATIYARGRADGKRDEVIDRHERRLDDGAQKIAAIGSTALANDKALAVLGAKVDSLTEAVCEVREMVRDLAKRR